MNDPDLAITSNTDWDKFHNGRPDLIVDPMIFRSADVYLRGRRGVEQMLPGKAQDEVWTALSANVGSLVAFFDALILSERLPIIDYGYTYDSQIGFDQQELYQHCNNAAGSKVLISVHVMNPVYEQAKAAAVEALRERPTLPRTLMTSVVQEMSAFDYNWQPDLSDLGKIRKKDELLVLRFLFGGLLFGAYAQMTGAGHLIQPKRSRLYLAAALAAPSAAYEQEKDLLDELNEVVRQTAGMPEGLTNVSALPSFLPYLLSKDPQSPDELLRSALTLRENDAVKDYRIWRNSLIADWREKGKIDRSNEMAIQEITGAVVRKLKMSEDKVLKFGLKAEVTGVGLEVGVPIHLGRLWGWILQHLPGRRYTKLLMRMQLAAQEYRSLDHHLHTIWNQV